jgi:hypothetical protein
MIRQEILHDFGERTFIMGNPSCASVQPNTRWGILVVWDHI